MFVLLPSVEIDSMPTAWRNLEDFLSTPGKEEERRPVIVAVEGVESFTLHSVITLCT